MEMLVMEKVDEEPDELDNGEIGTGYRVRCAQTYRAIA